MKTFFGWKREKSGAAGASMLELLMLVVLIVLISVAIVRTLGQTVRGKFDQVNTEFASW